MGENKQGHSELEEVSVEVKTTYIFFLSEKKETFAELSALYLKRKKKKKKKLAAVCSLTVGVFLPVLLKSGRTGGGYCATKPGNPTVVRSP